MSGDKPSAAQSPTLDARASAGTKPLGPGGGALATRAPVGAAAVAGAETRKAKPQPATASAATKRRTVQTRFMTTFHADGKTQLPAARVASGECRRGDGGTSAAPARSS